MALKAAELRDKRAKLIHDARAVLAVADTEKRDPTTEERTRFDKMLSDADVLHQDAERMERLERTERELETTLGRRSDPGQPGTGGGGSGAGDDNPEFWECEARDLNPRAQPGEKMRFDAAESAEMSRLVKRTSPKHVKAFRTHMRTGAVPQELRAYQVDNDAGGGYTVVPMQLAARLIVFVKNMLFVRQNATVIPVTNADSFGAPSLETDLNDADWTSELQTGTEDTAMAMGRRDLKPHPLAKQIKISNRLLRLSILDFEALVMDRLAYKFAVSEEKAFFTGMGSEQPLGVFTASAKGISTARDVSTGNTTTAVTPDGIFEAKYSLKVQYWQEARWAYNRSTVKQIAKFKDGEGQYLWQPSIQVGQPDRLLGFPIDMSEYVPNTYSTGQYVGILAAWSRYWIADSLTMTMQRLVELYAATNQVGFIARKETDGMPVLEEAFVRIKLA